MSAIKKHKKGKEKTPDKQSQNAASELTSPKAAAHKDNTIRNYFAESVSSIKTFLKKEADSFRDGIDGDKLVRFIKEIKIGIKKGLYSLAAIISVVAIMIVVELHSDQRVYPGTKAGAVDIGYLPVDQANEKLSLEIDAYKKGNQTFILGDVTKEIPRQQLGIKLNPIAQRDLPVIKFNRMNMANLLAAATQTHEVIIRHSIDGTKTLTTIEQTLQLGDKKTRNAMFIYQDSGLSIRPELHGVAIDENQLMKDLRARIEGLDDTPINLVLIEQTPRITAADLEAQRPHLESLLKRAVTLERGKQKFTFKPIDHLEAVKFVERDYASLPGGFVLPVKIAAASTKQSSSDAQIPQNEHVQITSKIELAIDPTMLDGIMAEPFFSKIEIPTSPAKIFTNEEGKVIIEGKGEDGVTIPREKTATTIALAINADLSTAPLPLSIDKAPLDISDDLKEIGITNLLTTGHSAYYGSPANRMFNIDFGTEKYNGLLIGPGEEFSFNEYLGEVDAKSGFKPEKVIKENKIEYEIGGGICQVSTTLYRAALQAGLPITERRPHSWKVSYYSQSMGDGLDATIYPGSADVKFINDTPSYLLIQAYTDGSEAYFKLYGTPDGRKTTLEGPFGGGLTYRWNRIIERDGQSTKEEIWSKYKPIPKDPINGDTPKPAVAEPSIKPDISSGPTI